jgi:purine nucleosidase
MMVNMNAETKPVLLDVDPGIDDALAMLLALSSPEVCVEAVTVVAGNVDVDQGVENALKVLELAGRTDVPVARGADSPLRGELRTARHVHGRNGLGDISLHEPSTKPHSGDAVDLISAKVEEHPGRITLIPVGPLTNIARALTTYPHLSKKINGIVLMGGSLSSGNITPAAEFNIFNDPEAAQIVLDAAVPTVMVTLDVTRKVHLRSEHLADVKRDSHPVNRFVLELSDFATRTRGKTGILLHDPLAVGVVIDPSFVKTAPAHVSVETEGETRGATTATQESAPNVVTCGYVNADRFVKFFLERVCQLGD